MRALCGAIITAGALIGLGLSAIGIGTRYQNYQKWETDPDKYAVPFFHMDNGLLFVIVVLAIAALIGLAIAFIGLGYHHHRRHHEHLRAERMHGAGGTVSPPAGPVATP